MSITTLYSRIWRLMLCGWMAVGLLSACGDPDTPAQPAPPPLAKELIFYDWADDLPQSIIDAFTAEYGVKVDYQTYDTTDEARQNLRAGQVYDVVVIDSPFVPELAAEGLLAEIDHRNVPNFKNISANFRELVSDPGDRYSVTYNWGLTGLIYLGDRVSPPVTRWADLWDPRFAGRLMVWNLQRSLVGIALRSLGFSINSENPAELEAALQRLLTLKTHARTAGWAPEVSEQVLVSGEVVLMYGWGGGRIARPRPQSQCSLRPACRGQHSVGRQPRDSHRQPTQIHRRGVHQFSAAAGNQRADRERTTLCYRQRGRVPVH
jgi:spermidine/putrescine transport system substrate-binding protein